MFFFLKLQTRRRRRRKIIIIIFFKKCFHKFFHNLFTKNKWMDQWMNGNCCGKIHFPRRKDNNNGKQGKQCKQLQQMSKWNDFHFQEIFQTGKNWDKIYVCGRVFIFFKNQPIFPIAFFIDLHFKEIFQNSEIVFTEICMIYNNFYNNNYIPH